MESCFPLRLSLCEGKELRVSVVNDIIKPYPENECALVGLMAHASVMHFPCFFPVIHLVYYSGAQKLHNECGNPKHGKEKNREKKEDNKNNLDKREKRKKRSRQHDELGNSVHKKKKLWYDRDREFLESLRDSKKVASDHWERSGLTEELELPSSIPNPCSSLESTQNSGKKNKLLVADMKRKDQGLVLRIKLPSMKHKLSVTSNGAVASPNTIHTSLARKASCLKAKALVKQQDLPSDPCFSGRATEARMTEEVAAADFISSINLEKEKCFSDLKFNWNPSSLHSFVNPGSPDWLFPPPSQSPHRNPIATSFKSIKPDHKVGLISATSLQPQACYLPELDIYQLPYVIPF